MVQEDQNQVCSNNSSGGGSRASSKKLKQKKVPQRGLGVAQLEKIRIEEQQKKDASNTTNFSFFSALLSPTHSSSIPMPSLATYPNKNESQTTISINPSSPQSNIASSNHIFRARSTSNFDDFDLSSIRSMNPSHGGTCDIGWPMLSTNGNVNVSLPAFWNPYELNLDQKEVSSRFDNHALSYRSSLSLPYESCPIGSLTDLIPKAQHYQQPSPLVNVSPMSSSSSTSSLLNFSMEPSSSQALYGNYLPLWSDEDKIMVGMKRSCPFPLDNQSVPNFHGKFAPIIPHPMSRSNESISCATGTTAFNFEPTIPVLREVPSLPSGMLESVNTKKGNRSRNGNSNGEFLTLGPPTTSSLPISRLKQSATFLASHNRQLYDFESLPYRGSVDDFVVDHEQVGPNQQPKFFSLFPNTKMQVQSTLAPIQQDGYNGDVGESVDLDLRL